MSGTFEPGGLGYPNHEAFSFVIREAAGQFLMLLISLSFFGFAGVVFASAPVQSTLWSLPFLLFLGAGVGITAALGLMLRAGAAHAPRSIRIGKDGIVACFKNESVAGTADGSIAVPYDSMTSFGRKKWEGHTVGKAVWYDFDPPQVRFLSPRSVPKKWRADLEDPEEGMLYLTDENLARVRAACAAWREKRGASSATLFGLENEMDEATAIALGEV